MAVTTYDIDQFVNDMKELQAKGLTDTRILDQGSSYLEKTDQKPRLYPPRVPCPLPQGQQPPPRLLPPSPLRRSPRLRRGLGPR